MGVQWRLCWAVGVAALLAVASAAGRGAPANDICSLCRCDSEGGVVKTITCDCNSQNKELNVTDDKLSKVHHVTHFAVANCTSVRFVQSAFRACHDLESVTVSRVRVATLEVGVFSALSSLHVEDVSDLRLGTGSLLGAELQRLSLHRSNVTALPRLALSGISGLRRLELRGVALGRVYEHALNLSMPEGSTFLIDGCEVGTMEKNSVRVQATEMTVHNSLFEDIRDGAVDASASLNMTMTKNLFGTNCSSRGIRVASRRILVDGNTFYVLPIGLLRRSPLAGGVTQISFINNIFHNFTLMRDGVDLNTILDLDDFHDNEVYCDCDLAKGVLAYKAFQSAEGPRAVVAHNHCHLDSDCKLSLQQLAEARDAVCRPEGAATPEDLCASLPQPDDVPTRAGRAWDPLPLDDDVTAVPDEPTQASHEPTQASPHAAHAGSAADSCVALRAAVVAAVLAGATLARFLSL